MNNFVFKIELKENYSNAFTKEKLGDHITAVFDYVSNIIEDKSVFSNKYKFSDQLYWECIDEIFENNIINDFLDYDLIEEELYEVIKSDLGEYYDDKDFYALDSLDFTISNYINNLRYKDSLGNYNPFSINNEILEKSGVLYTFTENIEHSYLRRTNKKESELTKDLSIGVISKCKRDRTSINYIKDSFGLRNLLLNILKSDSRNRSNPINKHDIILEFRNMGVKVEDISDKEILNWVVKPLKRSLKLGSNKEGYFIILDENDLHESYMSHYNNYLGYKATLDRHKDIAKYKNFPLEGFDFHL